MKRERIKTSVNVTEDIYESWIEIGKLLGKSQSQVIAHLINNYKQFALKKKLIKPNKYDEEDIEFEKQLESDEDLRSFEELQEQVIQIRKERGVPD